MGPQLVCLIASDGEESMTIFDTLEPWQRELIRNSRFNLCTVCVLTQSKDAEKGSDPQTFAQAIADFERLIAENGGTARADEPERVLPPDDGLAARET